MCLFSSTELLVVVVMFKCFFAYRPKCCCGHGERHWCLLNWVRLEISYRVAVVGLLF